MGKAIFVSHQWVKEQHPDPEAAQLRVLQGAMRNILGGHVTAVPDAYDEVVWATAGQALPTLDRRSWARVPLFAPRHSQRHVKSNEIH